MTYHADHRFSITIKTDDLAVVGCLRALAEFSQKTGNNRIPWGGTKDQNWRQAGKHVTFRFSSPEFRAGFEDEIRRLLPQTLWSIEGEHDDDPAKPQRRA
jgi:hypothetical protein